MDIPANNPLEVQYRFTPCFDFKLHMHIFILPYVIFDIIGTSHNFSTHLSVILCVIDSLAGAHTIMDLLSLYRIIFSNLS